jgi:hypothetical protein
MVQPTGIGLRSRQRTGPSSGEHASRMIKVAGKPRALPAVPLPSDTWFFGAAHCGETGSAAMVQQAIRQVGGLGRSFGPGGAML